MKERPISFIDWMVDAILDCRKTVTRRRIKDQPDTTEARLRELGAWVEGQTLSQHLNNAWRAGFIPVECPYGDPGDHLLVNGTGDQRVLLEVTDVRIELLQEITIGQICKEGLARSIYEFVPVTTAFACFAEVWNSIYGPEAWDANPWVWVVEFKRVTP